MRRLIDANALKEWFPDNGEGSWTYNVTVKACIDAQPTIDAVPIEFIQKRIDQLKEMNGRIFFANGGYTSPSDYEQWELERLVREWRDENAKTD